MLIPYHIPTDYEVLEKKFVATIVASWPSSKRLEKFYKSHKDGWARRRQIEIISVVDFCAESNYRKMWGNFQW